MLDRVDVDTDQIIPKQFLKRIERTGYGDFLFFDWRYDEDGNERRVRAQPPRVRGRAVLCRAQLRLRLVARACRRGRCRTTASTSSSRRRSATSSGRTAGKIGLVAIALPDAEVKRLMEGVDLDRARELTVDLERRVIVAPDGREVPFEIDESTRPAAERPRRHRPDAPARGRHHRVRSALHGDRVRLTSPSSPATASGPR